MTGWTWEYIDESMDIPRLTALNRYWAASPPIHTMLAAFFGYEPNKQQPEKQPDNSDEEMRALLEILHHVG